MKRISFLIAALLLLLSGCDWGEGEVRQAYQDGYEAGKHDAGIEAEEAAESAYQAGYESGAQDAYANVEYQPLDEGEAWQEGYKSGFYDGYQDGKKDQKAGAPDQYEQFDDWFYFWNGVYPEDVPPPTFSTD